MVRYREEKSAAKNNVKKRRRIVMKKVNSLKVSFGYSRCCHENDSFCDRIHHRWITREAKLRKAEIICFCLMLIAYASLFSAVLRDKAGAKEFFNIIDVLFFGLCIVLLSCELFSFLLGENKSKRSYMKKMRISEKNVLEYSVSTVFCFYNDGITIVNDNMSRHLFRYGDIIEVLEDTDRLEIILPDGHSYVIRSGDITYDEINKMRKILRRKAFFKYHCIDKMYCSNSSSKKKFFRGEELKEPDSLKTPVGKKLIEVRFDEEGKLDNLKRELKNQEIKIIDFGSTSSAYIRVDEIIEIGLAVYLSILAIMSLISFVTNNFVFWLFEEQYPMVEINMRCDVYDLLFGYEPRYYIAVPIIFINLAIYGLVAVCDYDNLKLNKKIRTLKYRIRYLSSEQTLECYEDFMLYRNAVGEAIIEWDNIRDVKIDKEGENPEFAVRYMENGKKRVIVIPIKGTFDENGAKHLIKIIAEQIIRHDESNEVQIVEQHLAEGSESYDVSSASDDENSASDGNNDDEYFK